jgi:hypothetical protein
MQYTRAFNYIPMEALAQNMATPVDTAMVAIEKAIHRFMRSDCISRKKPNK